MKIEEKKTQRGFRYLEFKDRYRQVCSLQASSLATEATVWFGVDERTDLYTGKPLKDSENFRMHLTQEMVEELLPALQHFAETGCILFEEDLEEEEYDEEDLEEDDTVDEDEEFELTPAQKTLHGMGSDDELYFHNMMMGGVDFVDKELLETLEDHGVLDEDFYVTPHGHEVWAAMQAGYGRFGPGRV